MSSRKKPQSTRKVAPPEWAADVKPSEDVMAMFYAPTGQPKSGPLVPLAPPAPDPKSEESKSTIQPSTNVAVNSVTERSVPPEEGSSRGFARGDSDTETIENNLESSDLSFGTEIPKVSSLPSDPPQSESDSQEIKVTESLETSLDLPETEELGKSQELEIINDTFSPEEPLTQKQTNRAPRGAEFDKHFGHWRPFLTQGQLSVLEALFDLTYAQGHSDCFTSNARLAAAAGISARQTSHILSDLERFGFLARLETFNTRTKKGTVLRLFLTRQMEPLNVTRRYHLVDE